MFEQLKNQENKPKELYQLFMTEYEIKILATTQEQQQFLNHKIQIFLQDRKKKIQVDDSDFDRLYGNLHNMHIGNLCNIPINVATTCYQSLSHRMFYLFSIKEQKIAVEHLDKKSWLDYIPYGCIGLFLYVTCIFSILIAVAIGSHVWWMLAICIALAVLSFIGVGFCAWNFNPSVREVVREFKLADFQKNGLFYANEQGLILREYLGLNKFREIDCTYWDSNNIDPVKIANRTLQIYEQQFKDQDFNAQYVTQNLQT